MRILIVEDNPSQLELLKRLLESEDYQADGYTDGNSGLYALSSGNYDLAILDRLLPELDGVSLLRKYRSQGGSTPVIMLTALSTVGDRVIGLDAGADDYVAKPFAPEELLARIRALLRRPSTLHNDSIRFGDVILYQQEGRLDGPDGSCGLSKREAALLYFFLSNPNQVFRRDVLLFRVWGADSEVEERNIDNFVFLVRRRLVNVGSRVTICTVRGFGYRLEVADA